MTGCNTKWHTDESRCHIYTYIYIFVYYVWRDATHVSVIVMGSHWSNSTLAVTRRHTDIRSNMSVIGNNGYGVDGKFMTCHEKDVFYHFFVHTLLCHQNGKYKGNEKYFFILVLARLKASSAVAVSSTGCLHSNGITLICSKNWDR